MNFLSQLSTTHEYILIKLKGDIDKKEQQWCQDDGGLGRILSLTI